jgi:uncharacterized protein YjiK
MTKKKLPFIFIAFILFFWSCSATRKDERSYAEAEKRTAGYNFEDPDVSFVLPDTLREISGLTLIDSTTFACVQDEDGILFIYDAVRNKIKKQYTFNIAGDYEGITRVGNTMYVLRSDGELFEILDYAAAGFKLKQYTTGIPANNNEGLCYDAANNRLLIACKSKIGKGREYKDRRVIYGFDLKTKRLSDEPVFDFDLNVIKAFAEENKIKLPVKSKKKGDEVFLRFATSAICIHPVTNKLYLLSAADHLLFIFDMNGTIEAIHNLDEKMFNKAEGITFYENGDMLITNEAQDKKPTLLRFNYQAEN